MMNKIDIPEEAKHRPSFMELVDDLPCNEGCLCVDDGYPPTTQAASRWPKPFDDDDVSLTESEMWYNNLEPE